MRTRDLAVVLALTSAAVSGCAPDADEEAREDEPAGAPVLDTADTLPVPGQAGDTAPDDEPAGPGAPDGTADDAADPAEPAGTPPRRAPDGPDRADTPTGPTEPAPAGPAPGTDEPDEGRTETLEGRVVISGAVPTTFPALEQEGGAVGLTGDLSRELRRLSGARVRVTGTLSGRGPGRTLEVVRYEILEVDGRRPRVGVVIRDADGLHLHEESGAAVPLASAPPSLQGRVGAKVWIVGPEEDGTLRVRSWGLIRPEG